MERADRIIPIDELPDFRVAEGDPDVRGWDVLSGDGRTIGEVNNLLVDVDAMKVRYLDVGIDNAVVDTESNRHILIPIGYARVDEADDRVFVDSLEATTVPKIPEYRDEVVTRDYESSLRVYFDNSFVSGKGSDGERADDFYKDDLYSSDRFYETRRTSSRKLGWTRNAGIDKEEVGGHDRTRPAPAFRDSGSYGANARVEPNEFGSEIIRDGEVRRDPTSDGLGEIREPRGRTSSGHFGSGWSDEEIVRTPLRSAENEIIRGL